MWGSDCTSIPGKAQKIQPHYATITRQDQVQIYQEVVRDPRGRRLTTSFLSLADEAKDSRLLPRSWTPSLALAEKTGLGSPKLSAAALIHRILPDLPHGRGGSVDDPWWGWGRPSFAPGKASLQTRHHVAHVSAVKSRRVQGSPR